VRFGDSACMVWPLVPMYLCICVSCCMDGVVEKIKELGGDCDGRGQGKRGLGAGEGDEVFSRFAWYAWSNTVSRDPWTGVEHCSGDSLRILLRDAGIEFRDAPDILTLQREPRRAWLAGGQLLNCFGAFLPSAGTQGVKESLQHGPLQI
jgi:hypothetical protein